MSLAALSICAASIYAFFLLWGLLQERLSSHVYPIGHLELSSVAGLRSLFSGTADSAGSTVHDLGLGNKFSSPLFLNATQSLFCALIAAAYLLAFKSSSQNHPKPKAQVDKGGKPRSRSALERLGLHALTTQGAESLRKLPAAPAHASGTKTNGHSPVVRTSKGLLPPLLSKYVMISLFQSTASQLGFLALSQGLSYPTLTLAKSCKLVPVLIMNVLLYQRKFALYKYVVVVLVTVGISIFMLYGKPKKAAKARKAGGGNTLVGLAFLTLNLVIDGATNSTQDEVFSRYTISGPQMMLVMNALSFLIMLSALLLPLHQVAAAVPLLGPHAVKLFGSPASTEGGANELAAALQFIATHPTVVRDIVAYAAAGALGQIAIFETLERFGSLTLVSITVSRPIPDLSAKQQFG